MDHRFCYAAFQKPGELLGNYGAAEKVSLAFAATFFLKKVELFLGLHALGDYAVLQTLSDVNQRAQNHGVVGVRGNVIYEAAVDFQGVQWKLSQIAEAGITNSKIVDG
jgi:hypothetical protein